MLILFSQGRDSSDCTSHFGVETLDKGNNVYTLTRRPYNPTRLHTSADLSFATRFTWRASHDLPSDHACIHIKITFNAQYKHRPRHTFTNYNKAHWEGFNLSIEGQLQNFNISEYTSIDEATKHFTKVIINYNKQFIHRKWKTLYPNIYTRHQHNKKNRHANISDRKLPLSHIE